MVDNTLVRNQLLELGLSPDETAIFMSLFQKPKTQLQVSRDTGIARSSVYRLVDELIEKSLVHEAVTDTGKLLESAEPAALELLVLQHESTSQQQRANLQTLLPMLAAMQRTDDTFGIKSYSGQAGLRQMLWNELKTKGEICMFSSGSLDKAAGTFFAEKFRGECMARGIQERAIENTGSDIPTRTEHASFFSTTYHLRLIDPKILPIPVEITIHDDTISIYNNWLSDIQIGTEIKNPFLVTFMQAQFDYFWQLAKEPS